MSWLSRATGVHINPIKNQYSGFGNAIRDAAIGAGGYAGISALMGGGGLGALGGIGSKIMGGLGAMGSMAGSVSSALGGAGGGWGGALGSLISGGASVYGGEQANQANAQEAQKNRDFQENMSNTQWQRGTADMKAAGLNPMLAYSQGGASQPGGGQATQQDVISPAIDKINQTRMNTAQMANLASQAQLNTSNAGKADADAAMTRAQIPFAGKQAEANVGATTSSAKAATAGAAVSEARLGEIAQAIKQSAQQVKGLELTQQLQARTMEAMVAIQKELAKQARSTTTIKDAEAQAAATVSRGIPGASTLTAIGEALGGGIADAKDWLTHVWSNLENKARAMPRPR